AQASRERRAQARLVRTALRGRDRVAIGVEEAVLVGHPAHRPLDGAVLALALDRAREQVLGHPGLAVDGRGQILLEPAWKVEDGPGRRLVRDEGGVKAPADLHSAEEVGLGPRHAEETRRLEGGAALAKDLLVRLEANLGAAPILHRPEFLELSGRDPALE